MRSLRGRLSLFIGLVIAVVLGVSGLLISNYAERIARDELDDRLRRTAELSRATAVDAVKRALPGTDKRLDAVLDATKSSLRLFVGDQVVLEAGTPLVRGRPPARGLHTVDGNRVLVTPVGGAGLGSLVKLEVASSLSTLEARRNDLDTRLLQLGAVALLVAAAGTFLAAVGLLNPLRRLRRTTSEIVDEADLSRRTPETEGPSEVRELAVDFNAMLARLAASVEARERALDATRRFALDAGHELRTPLTTVQATLDALHRHPEVDAEQRTAMLGDALEEQRRIVALLDGLQALARGDAAPAEHVEVDLAEIVESAAGNAELDLPDAPVIVSGWPEGLRMLVSNLVANAEHHGRGKVHVTLTGDPVQLIVDDEGDGIPPADRERIFEPFVRLDDAAERPGSGLGLALVAQQVREHGATIAVQDAPGGGARFVVTF